MHAPILVLNKNFQPIRITTARHAFLLLFLGRARALDRQYDAFDFDAWRDRILGDDEETIGTARGPIAVPRVLYLHGFSRTPKSPVRLSRRHLFIRDGFMCQYCGLKPATKDLNLDHVMPKSRGGPSTWENLVTSCRACNAKKGRLTPVEADMPLRCKPSRPNWSMALQMTVPHERYPEWEPFLVAS